MQVTTDSLVKRLEEAYELGIFEEWQLQDPRNLALARITDTPLTILSKTRYWHQEKKEWIAEDKGILLFPPDFSLDDDAPSDDEWKDIFKTVRDNLALEETTLENKRSQEMARERRFVEQPAP